MHNIKVIVIGKNGVKEESKLDGRTLQHVDTFKYFGINIHKSRTEGVAVVGRVKSMNKLCYALVKQNSRKEERNNPKNQNYRLQHGVQASLNIWMLKLASITNQMKSKI